MKTYSSALIKRFGVMLLVTIASASLWAQNITISGKIIDGTLKEGVIGASILVIGQTKGAVTDLDGNYTIADVPAKAKLRISYIGYKTQEVDVNGRSIIDLTLLEDSEQLDEVVVVGYTVQRKSDLTGAVSSVKMADALKSMPTSNVSDALQGRMAGVSIVSSSGAPGAAFTIRVRGVNSITGDGGPLVVIDGFIGGDFNSINPSDIQSIEVLKDASATAVYGSRGANGVLLVTTKRADKGTTRVTYSGYVNVKTPAKLPLQLSAGDNARLQNSYMEEIYGIPPYTVGHYFSADEITALDNGVGGADYLSSTFRNQAIEQMHEVSISGSTDKTQYLLSTSFNIDNGIVRNSSAKSANYRAKVDTEIRKWWKVGMNLWGTYNESQGPSFGQNLNVLNRALSFPRFLDVFDEKGNYNDLSREPNPMRKVNEIMSDGYRHRSYMQGYLNFDILKGLSFRTSIGFNFDNNNSQSTNNENSYNAHASQQGYTSASASYTNSFGFQNTNTLSYIKEINKNHRLNATLVFEQSYGETFKSSTTVRDLFDSSIGFNNMALAKSTQTPSSERTVTSMMSFLGRVNYVLMNKYMITGSYRYDGSSRLAKGNQWYGFPSLALAWDMQKEGFMNDISFISQFKPRFGFGITGNQAVPAYSAFSQISQSVDSDGEISLAGERRANPNLRWESTTSYNVGLDMGFLNNRFTASLEYYNKDSRDVILEVILPPTEGFKKELRNAASINNRGLEFTLGADVVDTRAFRWHTDLTLTYNVGTITNVNDQAFMEVSGNYEAQLYRFFPGQKLGIMYGYESMGIWSTEALANADPTKIPEGTEAGDYRYRDLDGDGKITPDKDRKEIGCGQAPFNWGWNNSFNYKNFDLSLFFTGFHGFDIYNNNNWLSVIDSRIAPNPQWLNRWSLANQNTDVPSFTGAAKNITAGGFASRYVEKGDFIKLKTITLGYSLSGEWMKKAGIHNFRFFASVQNPFIITEYSGIDPEITLKSSLMPGADWGYYPNGRNYMCGLNLTF